MRLLPKLISAFIAVAFAAATLADGPSLRIGTNFTGSSYGNEVDYQQRLTVERAQ